MVFLLIVQVKIIKPKVLETVHENHGRKHFCLLKQNPLYLKKKKPQQKNKKHSLPKVMLKLCCLANVGSICIIFLVTLNLSWKPKHSHGRTKILSEARETMDTN